MKQTIDKINTIISDNKYFLITSHKDPDGDSLGSQIAFYNVLKKIGKEVCVFNQGSMPDKYKFLDTENIIKFSADSLPFKPDVVLVIECPTLDRTGYVEKLIPENTYIVNIDHHGDNKSYGNINLVDASSCAVADIIYRIFISARYEITPKIAEALYTAIISDTGRFRFASTTAIGMRTAAELIDKGADPKRIADNLYSNRSPEIVRLLGSTLSSLILAGNGKIGYLTISLDDLKNTNADFENSEGFVDNILTVSGVYFGFLFKENSPNEVKVSVRSQNGINAALFAGRFGGGGHDNAAGFVKDGNFNDVVKQVVQAAEEFVDEQS
jgi:phosphoesterase RecJ-like protein